MDKANRLRETLQMKRERNRAEEILAFKMGFLLLKYRFMVQAIKFNMITRAFSLPVSRLESCGHVPEERSRDRRKAQQFMALL